MFSDHKKQSNKEKVYQKNHETLFTSLRADKILLPIFTFLPFVV